MTKRKCVIEIYSSCLLPTLKFYRWIWST